MADERWTPRYDEGLLEGDRVQFVKEMRGAQEIPYALFLHLAVNNEMRNLRYLQVATNVDPLARTGDSWFVLAAVTHSSGRTGVIEFPGGQVALANATSGSVEFNVAASTPGALAEAVDSLHSELSEGGSDSGVVWLNYWAAQRFGSDTVARRVRMPDWHDIAAAYPSETRRSIEGLLPLERPEHARLLLWHGPPGTGKTNAVRALTRAWSDWCVPHFATDPERLLGSSSYLLEVLTADDPDPSREREWRLVILEDAGELLTADAHERTGQALSRLLNATDGMLAQSANSLVLVTTNEPLGSLHPAVARQGRCLSDIEFTALPIEQANRWLESEGTSARVAVPTTIADLQAFATGRAEPSAERRFGFAA